MVSIVMGRDRDREQQTPCRRWLAVVALFLGMLVTGNAAPSPVSVEIVPLTLRPRTQAPLSVEVKLHSQSRTPLDGTLELEIWGEGVLLSRQRIPDLTLISGVAIQHLLLPPPRAGHWIEEVRARFITRAAAFDLGRFTLVGQSMAARHYVIGICRGDFGSDSQSQTWRALRPERLTQDEKTYAASVATVPAWLAAEDLPSPLGLCAFDTVLLEGPALGKLSEKQLADLATWVEGGGSLCLVAVRDLRPEHQAFLQRVVGGKTTTPEHPLILHRAGLGRVVLAHAPLEGDEQLMSSTWTDATKHLARMYGNYAAPASVDGNGWAQNYGLQEDVQSLLLQSLPQNARMIPGGVMAAILGAFVLLIGPGEWIVLGRLRRRRWTWVTFPIWAIACTLLTIRTARHYLGTADQSASIIITDYSPKGTALRENRIDLWFVGRNQDAVVDRRQALVVPFAMRDNMRSTNREREPIYEGRVPSHYTLRQPLAQWTPYLQRTLSFTPDPGATPLHWGAVDIDALLRSQDDTSYQIAMKLGAPGWSIHVFTSRGDHQVGPPGDRAGTTFRELSINKRPGWASSFAPSGRADLLDLTVDSNPEDCVVIAHRQVGREFQVQRCIYHPSDAKPRF